MNDIWYKTGLKLMWMKFLILMKSNNSLIH